MRPSARLAAAAFGTTLLLTGCGSASAPSPPSGVDELVVPSPSLDPADFDTRIDNPWLPLVPGSEWEYAVQQPGAARTVTVTVLEPTREVQGVAATAVQSVTANQRGEVLDDTIEWYAQDEAGNVWYLGEQGIWEAGVDGAEAGLAMPARPRVGDGYRKGYAEGVVEDRTLVVDLDGSASVPYGDLTDLLETTDSSPLEPEVVAHRSFARGIGLVRVVEKGEGDEQLVLAAFVRG